MPAENGLIATGFFFYPLKTLGFLMFPGDMKRDQWVAWNVLNKYVIQALYNHVTYVKFYSTISINTNSVFQYKPKNKEVNQPQLFFYLPSSRIFQLYHVIVASRTRLYNFPCLYMFAQRHIEALPVVNYFRESPTQDGQQGPK